MVGLGVVGLSWLMLFGGGVVRYIPIPVLVMRVTMMIIAIILAVVPWLKCLLVKAGSQTPIGWYNF
jgi:hypothetical protein